MGVLTARIARAATDRPYRERALIHERGAGRKRGRVLARMETGGLLRASAGRLRRGPHPLVASLRDQVEAFALAVRGEPVELLATAADGARAMHALDAARASAREGRPAEVGRPVATAQRAAAGPGATG